MIWIGRLDCPRDGAPAGWPGVAFYITMQGKDYNMAHSPVIRDYGAHVESANHTVVGTIKVIEGVWSPELQNQRDILVYLPASYEYGDRHYPVIYMQDGQNLFDDATSFGCKWGVDETLEAGNRRGLEAIVVGIPNMGERRKDEYSPWAHPGEGGGRGEAYIAFIVETLKPLIDREFRTLREREYTGIMGSSMGGLISLYGFFCCGDTFGFVGAMSPSLWFADRAIYNYMCEAPYVHGRIYLDVGTGEGEEALGDARRMQTWLMSRGYAQGRDLLYVEADEADHGELDWGGRLDRAFQFLLTGPAGALDSYEVHPWATVLHLPQGTRNRRRVGTMLRQQDVARAAASAETV